MESHRKRLNLITIVATLFYFVCNTETILIYFYESPIETPNSLWLKLQYKLDEVYGREEAVDIFSNITSIAWWFVENHKNVIFFIIISIMMIVSIIMGKKEKKLNKVLLVYYVVCFLIMAFVAFLASPRFADYYF